MFSVVVSELTSVLRRRENTVLRARLYPETAYVIPNAIVAEQFKPPLTTVPSDKGQLQSPPRLITHSQIGRAHV